jgi:hypothetical protein
MTTNIRRLRPDELGPDGFPLEPVQITFHPDRKSYLGEPCDGLWLAECPKLLGYCQYGTSPEAALHALRIDFSFDPICRVSRIKLPSPNAVRKRYETLKGLGGVDAASEALKPNGEPLGVSQNDLFAARREMQSMRELAKGVGWSEDQIAELVGLDDGMIELMASSETKTGWMDTPHARHSAARNKIRAFLEAEGTGIG